MEEDDDKPISAILKKMEEYDDFIDYKVGYTTNWSVAPTVNDMSWNIVFDDIVKDHNDMMEDRSYGILPVEHNPAVYTSHEQRERHEKYPALQKAWDDYNALFALTKGEPPNV